MTIDSNENLIFNDFNGKTQCISKENLKNAWELYVSYKPQTFCANYERDNVEQEFKLPDNLKQGELLLKAADRIKKERIEQKTKPEHYNKYKITPIEFILANDISFSEGNIIKYVSRWKDKGGIEDLQKAKEYIDILIKNEQNNGNTTKSN